MLELLKTALPYVGIGVAGIVVWSVVTKGVPAAFTGVKNFFTKAEADVKALEQRVVALEQKAVTPAVAVAPVAVVAPAVAPAHVAAPAAAGPTGAH